MSYPYGWNVPREAIASPYPTYEEIHRRDREIAAFLHAQDAISRQLECVRFPVRQVCEQLERNGDPRRANAFLISFCKRALPRIEQVSAQYRIADIDPAMAVKLFRGRSKNENVPNTASLLMGLVFRYNRLPDMSKSDIELLAGDIANFIRSDLAVEDEALGNAGELKNLHVLYMRAATIANLFHVEAPLWKRITTSYVMADDIGPATQRMINEKWWRGRLRRVAAAWREHLQIATGNVSKKKTPYASHTCVSEWREQRRRIREFLKGMELEDEDGNRISLIEKYDGSVANPAIRRCELMTRIRGFEDICTQLGYVGEFYTITAPSKYHATTKAGYRNHKWSGASPSTTQSYLTGLWSKIRAKLHRAELRIFGIRVAEPHHDGTPHWHMLMFMRPEDADRVREIIRSYACAEDAYELASDKAAKARFHAEAIDPEKGSATGYVAKYISKNIDGYALDGETDDESGELLKETAPAVSAWAARWHIRQFQFIGGAPVTVYRELRRLSDTDTAHGLSIEFAAVHDAADAGRWADYVNAQGGPFVRRDDLQVRTWYECAETYNQYGEEQIRIRGVYDASVGSDVPIITRATQWKIVPKRAQDLGVDVKGATAPSRSSVNNCTGEPEGDLAWLSDFDFSQPLNRRQKRQLMDLLRSERRQRKPVFDPRTKENAAALDRTMDEIKVLTGQDISKGEAIHLMAGSKMSIAGHWCRGSASGEVFSAKAERSIHDIVSVMKKLSNTSKRLGKFKSRK